MSLRIGDGDSPTANVPSSTRHQGQSTDPSLKTRLYDVLTRMYDLGFIGFGGPPVHIQILRRRFVDGKGGLPWMDEQTFQELFVIAQSLPGPGSTKLLFTVAQVHAGVVPALLAFLLWMLPGACVMYGLSLGIQRMGTTLPSSVYAFLSGLNAATVGGIALSAVQLSRQAITDPLTRALVLISASAGLCYNALWYYPVLIILGGFTTLLWDSRELLLKVFAGRSALPEPESSTTTRQRDSNVDSLETLEEVHSRIDIAKYSPSVTLGMIVTITLIVVFMVLLILRSTLKAPRHALAVFTNFYFAGTLIIGGGPVVTPLLREYVVEPGWVSPRDFLLGLAIIQALPGPNFNFAVYLGSLALAGHEFSIKTLLGAFLGALGIFSPGICLSIATQSGWYLLRKQPAVVRLLRGMNAIAVGLIFPAVYHLWQVGYLRPGQGGSVSLAEDPWWLAVAAITYTCVEWYGIPVPIAIVTGGIAGLAWWNVIGPFP
ncbi:hypothetical protein APHAL10511_001737 [Amanita phalloides]|nr:hypothetical protein APHAL10511_001737 [Amanita phalloides]